MNRRVVLIVMSVLLIILIAMLIVFGINRKQSGEEGLIANSTMVSDPCADQVELALLRTENQRLIAENMALNARLIDCLESKLPTKPVVSSGNKAPVKPVAPKSEPPKKQATVSPPVSPANVERNPVVGRANLDGLRENGIISFCVKANNDGGLHFPQYALDRGMTFSSIEANPSNDGNNWIVEPVEWIEGDYGLTVDGLFFVSDEIIRKTLQMGAIQLNQLVIKAPFTKWVEKPMTLIDGYWTYQAI